MNPCAMFSLGYYLGHFDLFVRIDFFCMMHSMPVDINLSCSVYNCQTMILAILLFVLANIPLLI